MTRTLALLLLALGSLCLDASLAQDAPPARLAARIQETLDEPRFKPTHWGLLLCDLSDGAVVYEFNADKLFAPASTTKLFTVAAALDAFGAEHRWETRVFRRGEVTDDGTLAGELILVAGGDLNLGGRIDEEGRIAYSNVDHTYADGFAPGILTPQDPLAGLHALAGQVRGQGITAIDDVLIDDRLFDHAESSGSGPTIVTPIVVNDNMIDVTIEPTEPGQPAELVWRPRSAAYDVACKIATVEADQATQVETALVDGRVLEIRGTIAVGKRLVRSFAVPQPHRFARALFIECLAQAGVRCAAPVADAPEPDRLPSGDSYTDAMCVARHTSAPFAEEAKLVLKVSHNLHASTLPLLVAAAHGKRTLADGLRLEREFLIRAGVDADSISFGGGAGGARSDFVTPRATVALLRHMAARPDFAVFRQALPVLGVDGTLSDSVPADSPARGKAQAKTGTYYWQNLLRGKHLLLSKALAGYLDASSGRTLAFAFFMNNVHLDNVQERVKMGQVLGHLCEISHEEL